MSFTPPSAYSLFKIGRSKDANEIYYYANLEPDGTLNQDEPISIHWIKRTRGNKIEPLTWIQSKFAYGLEFSNVSPTSAQFKFVSYSDRSFIIKKNADGDFRVYTYSNEKDVEVDRIFIQIDGGSFWFPKISKVSLYSLIAGTNIQSIETIRP